MISPFLYAVSGLLVRPLPWGESRVLLAQRASHKAFGDLWEF